MGDTTDDIFVVFDGPPSHNSCRFVETESPSGQGISVGEWIERADGYWALKIPVSGAKRIAELEHERDRLRQRAENLQQLYEQREQEVQKHCHELVKQSEEIDKLREELEHAKAR